MFFATTTFLPLIKRHTSTLVFMLMGRSLPTAFAPSIDVVYLCFAICLLHRYRSAASRCTNARRTMRYSLSRECEFTQSMSKHFMIDLYLNKFFPIKYMNHLSYH